MSSSWGAGRGKRHGAGPSRVRARRVRPYGLPAPRLVSPPIDFPSARIRALSSLLLAALPRAPCRVPRACEPATSLA